MTSPDETHFAKKHPSGAQADPAIEAALRPYAQAGELPCAVAFEIASELNREPKEVGRIADLLEVRLCKCQLGLFGYGPKKRIIQAAEHVSEDLEKAVRSRLDLGKLPCKSAWGIAEDLGLGKMEVSAACEALKIKISSCQLGAF